MARTRRTQIEMETARMERAISLLQQVVTDIRRHLSVTPEGVAMVSSALMTVAMLEHEVGRRITNSLTKFEVARPKGWDAMSFVEQQNWLVEHGLRDDDDE